MGDLGSTNTWLNFFQGHHIGDANWAIADKNEACAALTPGASSNGGWSDGQLSASGRFIRCSIRGDGNCGGGGNGGGCCRFEADCGDCGIDGSGGCHGSASNCAACGGNLMAALLHLGAGEGWTVHPAAQTSMKLARFLLKCTENQRLMFLWLPNLT